MLHLRERCEAIWPLIAKNRSNYRAAPPLAMTTWSEAPSVILRFSTKATP